MNSELHITNGDITTEILKKLNIKGDFITWREMLCEGKTTTEVGSESFWKHRFEFLKTSYKVTKKTFIDYTLKEYRALCKHKQQDEIVLWFEHNLFSQINMLAIISWLKRFRKGRKITLVQSGQIDNTSKFKTLSELTETQLKNLYNNRVELSLDDIEYADYIWQLYCSDSPLRLETVHKFNPMSPFAYLETAIQAHLQRFPSVENGLNKIENSILFTAQENQFKTKEELIGNLLGTQQNYGFGDTQYLKQTDNLKKLFSSFNPVTLSKTGKKVLENQINYYGKIRSNLSYLGGTKKYNYLYITEKGKLLKIAS